MLMQEAVRVGNECQYRIYVYFWGVGGGKLAQYQYCHTDYDVSSSTESIAYTWLLAGMVLPQERGGGGKRERERRGGGRGGREAKYHSTTVEMIKD